MTREEEEKLDALMATLEAGELAQAEAEAKRLFDGGSDSEALLAFACGCLHERKSSLAESFLETFVKRYPLSLQSPAIFLALRLSQQAQYDRAAYLAQIYLYSSMHYLQRQYGKPESPMSLEGTVLYSLPHAFFLASSIYTVVGARSYSRRLFDLARSLQVAKPNQEPTSLNLGTVDFIVKEEERLERELQDPRLRARDDEFEAFFETGEGLAPLLEYAHAASAPIFAIRLQAIAHYLKTSPSATIDGSEIFAPTRREEDGTFRLAGV